MTGLFNRPDLSGVAAAAASKPSSGGGEGNRGNGHGALGVLGGAVGAQSSGYVTVDMAGFNVDIGFDFDVDALGGQGREAALQLRAGNHEFAVAEERAVGAARGLAIGAEFLLAGFDLLVLAGGLAVHVGACRARAVAAFDTVGVTVTVDRDALRCAFVVAVGVPGGPALLGIGLARAVGVAGGGAFGETVVFADDVDAVVAVGFALGIAFGRTHGVGGQCAFVVAHVDEFGGAGRFVNAKLAAADIAVGVDFDFAVAQSFKANVVAFGDAGACGKRGGKTKDKTHETKKA